MTTKTVDELLVELDDKKLTDSIELAKSKGDDASLPFTEAHVTIIEGEQGGGKTNTAVARIRDAYDKDCVRIFCEKVMRIKCEVKNYDRKRRIAKIKYNGRMKRFHIPVSYNLHSPMSIFCNFHLFGIPYTHCPSFQHILQWLKQGIIVNGWLVVDEAYVGMNARASMQALGKELEKQYFQFRKMQLNVIIVTPMARLIDWTMRTIPTERIHCTYNSKTHKITLKIRKKGMPGERKLDYDGRQYWANFRTNERIDQ